MKFKSHLVTQASGSVGGTTYGHNSGGLYMRARSIPVNPNSSGQMAARNALGSLASRWNDNLTQLQREAWTNYAAGTLITDVFGDPLKLSGQQMYIRCNSPRLRAGEALVDDGPTVLGLPVLSLISLEIAGGSADLIYDNADPWAGEVGGFLFLQVSRYQNPGKNYFKGPFRFEQTLDGAVIPPASPLGINDPTVFGQAILDHIGQRLFVRARVSRADGRLSSVQMTSAIAEP